MLPVTSTISGVPTVPKSIFSVTLADLVSALRGLVYWAAGAIGLGAIMDPNALMILSTVVATALALGLSKLQNYLDARKAIAILQKGQGMTTVQTEKEIVKDINAGKTKLPSTPVK